MDVYFIYPNIDTDEGFAACKEALVKQINISRPFDYIEMNSLYVSYDKLYSGSFIVQIKFIKPLFSSPIHLHFIFTIIITQNFCSPSLCILSENWIEFNDFLSFFTKTVLFFLRFHVFTGCMSLHDDVMLFCLEVRFLLIYDFIYRHHIFCFYYMFVENTMQLSITCYVWISLFLFWV